MSSELTLDCRQASRLLSLSRERALDAGELAALERHLDACLMCTNVANQLEILHKAARTCGKGE